MLRIGPPVEHPAGRLADGGGVGEDPLHPLVGGELLALDDADGGELAGKLHVIAGGGLGLHVLVDPLVEAEIAGRDGVERHVARFDELRLGDRRVFPKANRPCQRLGDARPVSARRVGVDLHVRLDVLDRRLGIAVHQVGARGVEDPVRLRMGDEVAAFRKRAVVVRSDDQVLAAPAAVRSWAADVDDPREPHVVDGADAIGRLFDHHWPLREVDDGKVVDGVGVAGQENATSSPAVPTL